MEEDERQQHVVDPCADLCGGEHLQDHLQRLHTFCNQVDPICFHSTREEAQKARVAQGFQVLPETKTSVKAHPRHLLAAELSLVLIAMFSAFRPIPAPQQALGTLTHSRTFYKVYTKSYIE